MIPINIYFFHDNVKGEFRLRYRENNSKNYNILKCISGDEKISKIMGKGESFSRTEKRNEERL